MASGVWRRAPRDPHPRLTPLRFLFKLALLAGVLAGGAWFYGSRQPREHRVSSAITLVAPADTVWGTIRNIGGAVEWWDDLKSIRRLVDQPRESWEQDIGISGTVRIQVSSEVWGERLVTTILNDQQKDWGGRWIYTVQSSASGTEVTITEDGWVEKPLDRVMLKLMGGPHRSMDSYLKSLGAHFGETVNPRHSGG